MEKLKKFLLGFVTMFAFVLTACNMGHSALSVTISNITTAGKTGATFAVKYQDHKMYEEKGVDILIKSDTNNVTFIICEELGEEVEITIPQKGVYYSLNKLMTNNNQTFKYETYKDAVSKNYIITSNQDFNLTIKAIVGNMSEHKTSLLNPNDASTECTIPVKKTEK